MTIWAKKIWIKKKKSTSGFLFFFLQRKAWIHLVHLRLKIYLLNTINTTTNHKPPLYLFTHHRGTKMHYSGHQRKKSSYKLGAKNIYLWNHAPVDTAPCFFVMTEGSKPHNGAITLWNLPPLCPLTSERQGLGGKAAETGRCKNRPASLGQWLDAAGPTQSFSLRLMEEGWKESTGTQLKCRSAAVLYVIAATWRQCLLPTPILLHGTLYADTAHGAGVEMKWSASI